MVESTSKVTDLINENKKYFQNELAEFIYFRTYSRWLPEKQRREVWTETVKRYIDFMKENLGQKLNESEYQELYQAILNQEIMPSMRLLWSSGEAARKTHMAAYNCSFISPSKLTDFAEIMYILMCGTGVGFSVEKKQIKKFPKIKKQSEEHLGTYAIEDSKEGWGNVMTAGITAWFNGQDIYFDYSKLRPAGARLQTMGGQSSGPDPLKNLLDFTRDKILSRQGKKLRPIDVHDIVCKVGEIIVMGGVRRSALISLSDIDDTDMRISKVGEFWHKNPQRFLANNSAIYNKKPNTMDFLREWSSLANSGSGERGIFNRGNIFNNLPERRKQKFKGHLGTCGTNPCQPYNASVLSKNGIKKFGELNIGDEVWSESGWTKVINKQYTGIKPIFKYRTNAGVFYGTKNHKVVSHGKKIEVKDSQCIDLLTGNFELTDLNPQDIMDGLVVGDGSVHLTSKHKIYLTIGHKDGDYFKSEVKNLILGEHPVKYGLAYKIQTTIQPEELPNTHQRMVPERFFYGDKKRIAGFLRGIYSANGSICGNRVTLKSTSEDLVEHVQIMLNSLGISSYITENKPNKTKFKNGEYLCKRSFDINISHDREKFFDLVGFIQQYKMDRLKGLVSELYRSNMARKRKKNTYDIKSIEYIRDEKVYNITVDNEAHTYWTGGLNVSNCGEILLRNRQLCNLTEIVAREEDTKDSLLRKTRIATILGTYQSSLNKFPYVSKEWQDNCEEERLLGVSITGQWDSPAVRDADTLNEMRELAIEVNKEYAGKFGINQSTAITCVKPSGTVSQLVNSSSGMHPRHAKYYIRRIRISSTDPLFQMIKKFGYPYHPEVGQSLENATTYVLEFPVKASNSTVTKDDISTIEQLEYWKLLKENFTEHNPSITISVGDNEWIECANWLYKNWDIIGGLSFLPRDNFVYQLAPYQTITEKKYSELVDSLPKINFGNVLLEETEDNTEGAKSLACVSGVCDIGDVVP